jgi:hypothetical protein
VLRLWNTPKRRNPITGQTSIKTYLKVGLD